MSRTVYTFGGGARHDDPRQKDKTVTGGKGANLAEMASIGLPVPPGFTITTEECVRYLAEGADFSAELHEEVAQALTHIEQAVGSVEQALDRALGAEDFEGAMRELAGLRGPVDAFFEKVLVNSEVPAERENRLRLLGQVRDLMGRVADFSLITG